MRYNVDVKEKALLDLKKLKFHEPKAYNKALKLIADYMNIQQLAQDILNL